MSARKTTLPETKLTSKRNSRGQGQILRKKTQNKKTFKNFIFKGYFRDSNQKFKKDI